MKYKLFIDDERYPATPDWWVARTSYDAIYALTNYGFPQEIAFDHDLGGQDTAIVFLGWLEDQLIEETLNFPEGFTFSVHSQNPIGAINIKEKMNLLIKYFGYTKQGENDGT